MKKILTFAGLGFILLQSNVYGMGGEMSEQQKAVIKRFQDRVAALEAQQGHMVNEQYYNQMEAAAADFVQEAKEIAPHLQQQLQQLPEQAPQVPQGERPHMGH